ncbi:YadA-like family protein [Escherichia coli]|uniref:YadA-like family protein n=1 Tax=Escherichia coli TaxID=562 RepID=UPI00287B5317|nr:YadA-like family protein [Escherichia coli]EJY6359005.1 YadA-like family protein [Escherichia coli]ELJ0864429.1 YadA-like family protein [Escherichia coli]ELJ1473323.1 YadA-like family protein [Escherichia coli]ELW9986635.1 YadA-like family protein [Escherichia coli]MDS1514404.1 YadA-like family protein [Escherichia coli]
MKYKRKLLCVSIALAITPVAVTFAEKNDAHLEVDDKDTVDKAGNNWMSIEIGTINEVPENSDKGIYFAHTSPVALGRNSIAIGTSAVAGEAITTEEGFKTGESIAIGAKAKAQREQSIAIGGDTIASGWGAIAIGGDDLTPIGGQQFGGITIPKTYEKSEAKGDASIVIGSQSKALGPLSLTVGAVSSATGMGANAIGATAAANGNQSNAIGFNTKADAENSIALGSYSRIDGGDSANSVAIGFNANTNKKSAIAIGAGATVSSSDKSVSIGSGSVDKLATPVDNVKINNRTYAGFAASNPQAVFSIGAERNERQIVNVAAGSISNTSTDAINGSQLYAVAKTLGEEIDTINPLWMLKDEDGHVATINTGAMAANNSITVKGSGDIDVTVDKDVVTIDGTALKNSITQSAIKIKGGDSKELTKKLGDSVEIIGKGPLKTQVVDDKLEITAEIADFVTNENSGNGKITVNKGDDNKLVTAKNIAEAINQSGWKIKADKDTGGVIEGNGKGTETLIKPGDMVTLKAGKNLSVKQSNGDFTFSVVDTPSFSSVQLNGKGNNGSVTLSSEGNKLTLSGGNGVGQNGGVVISGVASGLNGKTLDTITDNEKFNAASIADLKTAIDGVSTSMQGAGFALKDSNDKEVKQSFGKAIKVSGDSNITTTAITDNGDNKELKISLNNDLSVGSNNTAGSIKVNGVDGKEAVSLNGKDGTIKLISTPAANGKSASATIAVNAGKGGLTDVAGTTKTRLTYTPDEKSPAEELATMNDGLSFVGDDGKVIHKKLNEKLTIKGGAGDNEDVTDSNIRIDANEKGDGLLVRMTRNLRDLASAVFGTGEQITTVNDKGITITTPAAGGGQGKTVSLTGAGLNNGGNQITGVASGLNGTALADAGGDVLNNAANIGDLKNALRDSSAALVNTGFGLQADDGSKVNTSLGKHITVGGDGQNISTTVQNGSLTVRLADNIRLADDGSVSVGGTRMDKNGLTIKDGPSVTVNGIDAAGRVISGVKDGVNDQDAVNVSQLNREISQATAATTWALKTESGDEAVAVSSQTVEVRHGQNTRVSAISKDDKGNYSYEIDVTGIPVEYTDSQGNPLVNIGGRFYTQTEDAATGKLTMTPAEPARVRISSEQPLVLTNVAAGNVSPVSTDAVNGSQLASAARIAGGDNVVWKDGKAALAPDTFSELTTAGGGKTTVNGGVHKTPDNVADAVNMLNREGTKYFKAASSGQAAKAEGRDSIAVGQGAVSRGQNSIAMGNGAEVTRQAAAGSVAIGSHARAGRANTGTYALNGQAVAGRTGSDTAVVSFGQPGQERQLQSVAPGVLSANSTDAVNGSQLHATNRQVAGNTQAINTLGNKFSQLSYRVEELNRDIRGVGASAAAMSGIPQAYLPGKSLMGLGVGGYGGESAIAIGVSRISDNGKVIMKLNAGQNTRGNFSVGAGVGWQW